VISESTAAREGSSPTSGVREGAVDMSESESAVESSVLAEPLHLGKRVMRNRIVQAPLSVCYAGLDGQVTPKTIAHYARRAAGGVGMVITENFAISDAGRQLPRHGLVSGPEHVPGLTRLARAIQSHGALAVLQVVHAGRYAGPWEEYDARRRLAPSAVAFPLTGDRLVTPAEMTRAEIDEVTEQFVRAAVLARQAGFDGVELHGAQGFLLSSFQSPRMNHRSDEYGATFAGRTRLTLEVTKAVLEAVGDDVLVGFHLMSDEMMPGGWEPSDAVRLAQLLGDLGVDFIAPIPTTFESLRDQLSRGRADPTALHPEVFRSISEATTVPLFANGGLGHPARAESVVANGVASAVMLGRSVLADPDWADKHLGRIDEPLITCACNPPTCLATQLSGAICHAWSPDDQKRGFVGTLDGVEKSEGRPHFETAAGC
jgi:2,4-dienoyl-CoA reductase (NADPH2)